MPNGDNLPETLSEVVFELTLNPHTFTLNQWAEITWGCVQEKGGYTWLQHPSVSRGPSGKLVQHFSVGLSDNPRLMTALRLWVSWVSASRGGQLPPPASLILAAIPGGSRILTKKWIQEIRSASHLVYEEYRAIRVQYDARIADGVEERRAWLSARAQLRGDPDPDLRRPRRPSVGVEPIPEELRPAFLSIGSDGRLQDSTVRMYRSAVRRIFEALDGGNWMDSSALYQAWKSAAQKYRYVASSGKPAWRSFCEEAKDRGSVVPLIPKKEI